MRRILPETQLKSIETWHRPLVDSGNQEPGISQGTARESVGDYWRGSAAGNVYVADTGNNRVRKISAGPNPIVTTIAGSGTRGYQDGPAAAAQFDFPNDLTMDAAGNLYVCEFHNHTVRKITPSGLVSTFAGNGTAGVSDGIATAAQFNLPAGIAIDTAGNLFVTEWGSHRIRKITPAGAVTVFAGNISPGHTDGSGAQAQFDLPDGIVVDALGNLFISEDGNHDIRRIGPDAIVSTFAGSGTAGYLDGPRRLLSSMDPAAWDLIPPAI